MNQGYRDTIEEVTEDDKNRYKLYAAFPCPFA